MRQMISASLDCGSVQQLAAAIYVEYPQMQGCTQVVSAAGKVRVTTTADVDVLKVEAFVCDYADRLAEGQRIMREAHEVYMAQDHLKEKYSRAVVRRQQSVRRQANSLRIGR